MDNFLNFEDFNASEEMSEFINQINDNSQEENNQENNNESENLNKEVNSNKLSEADKINNDNLQKPLSTPSSDSDNEDSTISVFARMLNEEGVLPFEEEDLNNIKSIDDLKEKVKDSLARFIETKKYEGLNESQKRYLGAVEAGIPQNEFDELERNLNVIERLTPEVLEQDDKARFNIIAMSYISKGIPKEKALKMANASFQMQTDIEDAVEARELLYSDMKTKYESKIEEKVNEHKLSLEQLKTKIDETENVLGGLKLTPKMKEDIYKSMTTKVDSDENGMPMNALDKWVRENPIESKIILHSIRVATNNFKNLGRLGDVAKNKAISQLEQKLKQSENLQFDSSGLKYQGLDLNINV